MKTFNEHNELSESALDKKGIISFINLQLKGKSKSYSHDTKSNGWIANKGEVKLIPFLNKVVRYGNLYKGKYWGQDVMGKKTWSLTGSIDGGGEVVISIMSVDGKLLSDVEVKFRNA